MEIRTRWALAASAVFVVGVAAWLATRVYEPSEGVQPAKSGNANFSLMHAGGSVVPVSAGSGGMADDGAAGAALHTPDEVRELMQAQPGLKGTQPDGDCVVDGAGRLKPDIELRRRFDYYLRAKDAVAAADLRGLVAMEACAGHSPDVAAQMLIVWDQYRQLDAYPYQYNFDSKNPVNWTPAFKERKQVRRKILGQEWSEAFYGAEEAQFDKLVDSLTGKAGAN